MTLSLATVPPTLSTDQLLVFLAQLAGLLVLATLAGRASVRLGFPALTGELLVGVVLGPSVLGQLTDAQWLPGHNAGQQALLDVVGQLGVLLLVGLTGASLDLKRVRARATAATRVSIAGLVIPLAAGVTLGLFVPEALFKGERVTFALLLGVALAVSAIPVIARILMDLKLTEHNVGQLILTASAFDDAVGWLLLSVVSAMASGGALLWVAGSSLGFLLLAVAFTVTVGRYLVRALMRRTANPVATAVILMLLCAAGANALGFEPVFGAFLAGIMIGTDRGLEPLRVMVLSVFAPVFFVMAGLRMDLTLLAEPAVLLAGVAVLLVAVVGKVGGVYLGARLSHLHHWEAVAVGVGLNARGVIEVIVATIGVRIGVLSTAGYTVIVLVAVVTSVLAPPLLRSAVARLDAVTTTSR